MNACCSSVLLLASSFLAQDAAKTAVCSIQGTIRDQQWQSVSNAPVEVKSSNDGRHWTTKTDVKGYYCFASLPKGNYEVHAVGPDSSGNGTTAIVKGQPVVIDLTLKVGKSSTGASNAVQFFDEPQFTVAGVTDTTNLGGHGSDTVVRTKDNMAREVAGLSRDSRDSDTSATNMVKAGGDVTSKHEPQSFEDNRQTGKALLVAGRGREALSYLERAGQLKPGDPENEFDLATALFYCGDAQSAKQRLKAQLTTHDTAPVHHLLALVEEKLNDPLEAVRHYQRAAELEPNEANLFDWGAELLLHHANEPALQVFSEASRQYPRSVLMRVGSGVASYTRGSFDQAVRNLCEASDLDPSDSRPYLFLGRILAAESSQVPTIVEKMERFVRVMPENPWANYYLALGLMKLRSPEAQGSSRIEALLQKAIRLDPKFDAAYLQLGIWYFDKKDYGRAIRAYQNAVAVNANLEDAHYRLAQAYRQSGETEKARDETRTYILLSKKRTEQVERERHEIQQFVYSLQTKPEPARP